MLEEPRNIVVRAPNWLGDAVMALPTFAALRERYPGARIAAAARAHLADVFAACPAIDEVIPVPRGALAIARHAWGLRARRFDLGILLTNSFATAAWLRLAGARERVGYARDGRWFLLTRAEPATPEILAAHQAEYYFALLRGCGINGPLGRPRLAPTDEAQKEAAAWLAAQGLTGRRYAVIAPCSAFGPVKDWPPERYGEVALALARDHGLDVLATGTPAQRETIARVCAPGAASADAGGAPAAQATQATQSMGTRAASVHNAAGAVSLRGLFALIAGASVFVGGDSGAAHAAAALGTPTVVIFGITEPSRTRPLGDDAIIRVIGEGGMETPDLHSPAVAAAARRALEAIAPATVLNAATGIMRG